MSRMAIVYLNSKIVQKQLRKQITSLVAARTEFRKFLETLLKALLKMR